MSRAILLPWQERLFRILMALLGVLLLNSAALWCWTRTPDPPLAYYALLLFHFALGLLVVIPFTVYAWSHQRRARSLSGNRPAMWFGALTAIAGVLCMGVGVYMLGLAALGGAVTRHREWCLYLHRFTAWAMPFLYALHARARALRMAPGSQRRRLQAVATTSILALLAVLGVGVRKSVASNADFHLPPVDPYANKQSPFFPSEASSSTGGVLPVNLLLESQQCATCHSDIYRQWSESAHHFSSFNNPWYKASIDYMRDIDGPTATQWCAGCHDAAMLFPGIMKMKEKLHLPESHAGVACLVCHGIVEVKNTTGNGSYVLAPPPQYPWEGDGNPVLESLSRFLIRVKPAPHRFAMLKPFHREPHLKSQFCSACHKVSLSEPFDNYRWFRGFDTWDEFQDSGVSGFSARSFYQPAHPMECTDCHMPLVPSQDFGNVDGMVHSHRFPAANTAMASLKGCTEQLAITRKFLEGTVTVDLFAAGDPDDPTHMQAPMESAPIRVRPGHKLRADLLVRNRGVGHAFPTGTTDAVETWTELKVTDASRKTIFWSGFQRPDGTVDPTAHFFHAVLVDQHGNRINKRNAWQRRSTVYNEVIPPGAAKVVRYRIDVPQDVKLPLTLEAHLWYRKFDSYFNRFSFDGHLDTSDPKALKRFDKGWDDRPWRIDGDQHPDIPTVDMSSARVQLGPGAHNTTPSWPLWERYNDYGIGMLLATDYRLAEWSWETVTRLKPDYVDGYVNRARAALNEGSDADAEQWLDRALKLDPTFYKAHYFMGLVDKNAGRYEDAAKELESVAARCPDDREVQNVLGRLYLLLGDYDKAIAHYDHVLDIDPQDMTAHQGLMLSYDGKGDDKMARAHEARFLRFRPEETETQYNEPYLLAHPNENVESQPIHEHVSGDWHH